MLIPVCAEGARALHLDSVLGDADGLCLQGEPTVKTVRMCRVWEALGVQALRLIKSQDQLDIHFRMM